MRIEFISKQSARIIIYSLLFIYILFSFLIIKQIHIGAVKRTAQENAMIKKDEQFRQIVTKYKKLKEKQINYQSQGVDTATMQNGFSQIKKTIFTVQDFKTAQKLIDTSSKDLDQLLAQKKLQQQQAEEAARKAQEEARQAELAKQAEQARIAQQQEAQKGTLSGMVNGTGSIYNALVTIKSGKVNITSVKTDKNGKFSLKIKQGNYTLVISASKYKVLYRYNTQVTAQQTTSVNITMTPIAAKNSTPPTTNSIYTPTPYTPSTYSPQKMRDYLNKIRAERGIAPVQGNDLLDQAALAKVKHMAANDYFAHCQPGANICDTTFIAQTGFVISAGPCTTEGVCGIHNGVGTIGCTVLAAGGMSEEDAIDIWMAATDGHMQCITNPIPSWMVNEYKSEVIGFAGYGGLFAGFVGYIK